MFSNANRPVKNPMVASSFDFQISQAVGELCLEHVGNFLFPMLGGLVGLQLVFMHLPRGTEDGGF